MAMLRVGADRWLVLILGVIVSLSAVDRIEAAVVFDQREQFFRSAVTSDRDFAPGGVQAADDFTLTQNATIRSVEWRGWLFGAKTLELPLSFDLIIYADDGILPARPDLDNILSQTTVNFSSQSSFILTGRQSVGPNNGPEYGFEADINPVALTAGTKYWFSVLANTANDTDDNFLWTVNQNNFLGEAAAARTNISPQTQFLANLNGPLYFALDDEAIPEPSSTAIVVCVLAAAMMRRRRGNV